MDDTEEDTYIAWVLCDLCFRGFKYAEKLIDHKKTAHPVPKLVQSSTTTKGKSRTTKRKIVNEIPNGGKRKCGRPRKVKTEVNKNTKVKKEEELKQLKSDSSSYNSKAKTSVPPPLTIPVKITEPLSLSTQSRSPSTSPTKATKTKECNRLLAAFHNPKSFSNKNNNRSKNKSRVSTSKKSQTIKSSSNLSNANKSLQGETIRCPQCLCVLESNGALKMHMGLHSAILIIPNASSSNRKPETLSLSSSSSTASSSSTPSIKSNVKQSTSFLVKNKPIQCKKCHKILIEPPFKCIDCVGSKIVFDIPMKSSEVLVKQESVQDMDTQISYINNNNNVVSKKNKNLVSHIENYADEEKGKEDGKEEDDDDVLPIEVISNKNLAQIEVIDVN